MLTLHPYESRISSMQKHRWWLVPLAALFTAHAMGADHMKAASYYEDAVAKFDNKDTKAALIQLKNALVQDPNLLPAHVLLARTYLDLGEGASAEAALREASRLGADRSATIVALARAYLLQLKYKE